MRSAALALLLCSFAAPAAAQMCEPEEELARELVRTLSPGPMPAAVVPLAPSQAGPAAPAPPLVLRLRVEISAEGSDIRVEVVVEAWDRSAGAAVGETRTAVTVAPRAVRTLIPELAGAVRDHLSRLTAGRSFVVALAVGPPRVRLLGP